MISQAEGSQLSLTPSVLQWNNNMLRQHAEDITTSAAESEVKQIHNAPIYQKWTAAVSPQHLYRTKMKAVLQGR